MENFHGRYIVIQSKLSVIYCRGDDTWCGAAIVTENVVLTAAHCMFDHYKNSIPKEEFVLRVGEHDITVIN